MTSSSFWLAVAGGAGAIAMACAAMRYRVGRISRQIRASFERRLADHERASRNAQDDLLQSAQGLVLTLQAASREIAESTPARFRLESSLARADQFLQLASTRLLDTRVPLDTAQDLPKALALAGADLAAFGSAAFLASTEGKPRKMDTAAHDAAYGFGRRMLIHAFGQAGVSNVELRLLFGERELRLRLSADHADFRRAPDDPAITSITPGATVDFWNRLDAGSEVELRIPANVAYARGRGGFGMSRFNCLARTS